MKKQVRISGTPAGEIQIGYPATILEGKNTRHTSTVLAIYAKSKRKLIFETRNTIYFLEYPEYKVPENFISTGKALVRKLTSFRAGGGQ